MRPQPGISTTNLPPHPRQDPSTGPVDPGGSSGRRGWVVLAICCLSLFVVGLDTTMVNVALPAIGQDLNVGTSGLEWTVNAYTLVLASLLISSGAVADRVGRRRVFQLGLLVFGVASAACALAPSIGLLIGARVVQGVGGSMLSPVALAIVVNVITDPRERARAIGVWAAVFGVSMAAGPVTGGALVESLGWRSVFWINVPVVVAVLLLTAFFVPESRGQRPRRLDVPGQLLLIVMVGGTVAMLIEGPRIGWVSPVALIGYAVVAAATAGFVWTESRRREPLMDLGLFRRKPFTAAVVGAVVVFVALNATLLLGTLYLQDARGMSAFAAGAVTLPMALGATACAPLSGILVGRVGARRPLLIAGTFTTLGGLCLVSLDQDTSILVLLLAYLLLGIGFGFSNAPITNTAVNGLPADRSGVAGGLTSTARQFGAALGVALAGGVIATAAPADLAHASRPGWILVACCGLLVLLVARVSPTAGKSS
ncbi:MULTISPECIES: MFS transporter [unclassified Rhodococcus (in: high G+C Gram-positive bacteria)]|uniref:MFS transporter n=1 Tax=unclassified Rhodococcus (in: high G+C Gram-positive bacteria) TaxID=192944 RepID=UPI001B587417|nr:MULTISPECIES: MFS transporter [unclassified Rhodococcus (in: high G+C Gram-positive bacteria)]MBP1161910.1 EmrB/QacA subfamily drug resistance transporter [Rhodococcus sp. PvR099]